MVKNVVDADDSRDWVAPVAALQTDVGNLRQEVHSIARSIKELGDSVFAGMERLRASQGNTSYSLPTILAFVGGIFALMLTSTGVVLALCAAIGSLALQPIQEEIAGLQSQIVSTQTQVNRNETSIAAQHVQNIEIETQFRTSSQLESERFAHVKELESLRNQLSSVRESRLQDRVEYIWETLKLPEIKEPKP